MIDLTIIKEERPRKGPHRMSKSEKSPAQERWKKEQSRLRRLRQFRSRWRSEFGYVYSPYVPIQATHAPYVPIEATWTERNLKQRVADYRLDPLALTTVTREDHD